VTDIQQTSAANMSNPNEKVPQGNVMSSRIRAGIHSTSANGSTQQRRTGKITGKIRNAPRKTVDYTSGGGESGTNTNTNSSQKRSGAYMSSFRNSVRAFSTKFVNQYVRAVVVGFVALQQVLMVVAVNDFKGYYKTLGVRPSKSTNIRDIKKA
jgi:hypothetical protein